MGTAGADTNELQSLWAASLHSSTEEGPYMTAATNLTISVAFLTRAIRNTWRWVKGAGYNQLEYNVVNTVTGIKKGRVLGG